MFDTVENGIYKLVVKVEGYYRVTASGAKGGDAQLQCMLRRPL